MNIFFDVECYVNYFYVRFHAPNHIYRIRLFNDELELGDRKVVKAFLKKKGSTFVGFNSSNYDLPMLAAFLLGWNNAKLKKLSDYIISSNKPWWMLSDRFPSVQIPDVDHIDLTGVTPLQASLKTYACRIHTEDLRDLPIPPDMVITRDMLEVLESYCGNDCDMTADIFMVSMPALRLRKDMGKEYGQDFRSKSEPQIAEAVLRQEIRRAGGSVGKREGRVKPFRYQMPDFIQFKSKELKDVRAAVIGARFKVNKNGYAELPDELNQVIEFAGAKYKMGIGGLHSQEKHQSVIAGDKVLGEWDVGSMYPSIILGQSLYPDHIGEEFSDVYREIFDTRMEAKRAGNKIVSESLKLVLNSSFGKFGSKYSFLYSPELLVQTTITGQLSLLMLIERFTKAGARVVSANTDGVVVLHDKDIDLQRQVEKWEAATNMKLEWTPYRALHSESVNNYVALYQDGGVKLKGTYAPASIGKGYQNEIVTDAIVAYLDQGTPIEVTIGGCGDIRKFLTMRGIRAGGVWEGQDVGRVARWYVSTDGHPIRYKSNGNKVAGSDNAVPMMKLGSVPEDLDRAWYIERAQGLLKKLGV